MAGFLEVLVKSANGLKETELFGKANPYCQLTCGRYSVRTKTAKDGGRNPVWQEVLHFNLSTEDELQVEVYSEHHLSRDSLMGQGAVQLNKVRNHGRDDVMLPVLLKSGKQHGSVTLVLTFRGNRPNPTSIGQPVTVGAAVNAPPLSRPPSVSPVSRVGSQAGTQSALTATSQPISAASARSTRPGAAGPGMGAIASISPRSTSSAKSLQAMGMAVRGAGLTAPSPAPVTPKAGDGDGNLGVGDAGVAPATFPAGLGFPPSLTGAAASTGQEAKLGAGVPVAAAHSGPSPMGGMQPSGADGGQPHGVGRAAGPLGLTQASEQWVRSVLRAPQILGLSHNQAVSVYRYVLGALTDEEVAGLGPGDFQPFVGLPATHSSGGGRRSGGVPTIRANRSTVSQVDVASNFDMSRLQAILDFYEVDDSEGGEGEEAGSVAQQPRSGPVGHPPTEEAVHAGLAAAAAAALAAAEGSPSHSAAVRGSAGGGGTVAVQADDEGDSAFASAHAWRALTESGLADAAGPERDCTAEGGPRAAVGGPKGEAGDVGAVVAKLLQGSGTQSPEVEQELMQELTQLQAVAPTVLRLLGLPAATSSQRTQLPPTKSRRRSSAHGAEQADGNGSAPSHTGSLRSGAVAGGMAGRLSDPGYDRAQLAARLDQLNSEVALLHSQLGVTSSSGGSGSMPGNGVQRMPASAADALVCLGQGMMLVQQSELEELRASAAARAAAEGRLSTVHKNLAEALAKCAAAEQRLEALQIEAVAVPLAEYEDLELCKQQRDMLQAKLTSLDSGTSVIVTKSLYLDLQHASNVSAAAVSEAAALRADLAAQGTQRDARLADLEHQFAELKAKVAEAERIRAELAAVQTELEHCNERLRLETDRAKALAGKVEGAAREAGLLRSKLQAAEARVLKLQQQVHDSTGEREHARAELRMARLQVAQDSATIQQLLQRAAELEQARSAATDDPQP